MDEANQCLGCKKPRCQQGCPIQTNIPEVIRLLKANKLDEAGRKAGIVRCCFRITTLVETHIVRPRTSCEIFRNSNNPTAGLLKNDYTST